MTQRRIVSNVTSRDTRDLRIDFFRGLALLFIFIDHVPGNGLANFTLRNFGFADAAEVFVLLAGFSAVLAYGRTFDTRSFQDGATQVGHRIWDIYSWHILVIGISAMILLAASAAFADPKFVTHVGLQPFIENPARGFMQAMVLFNQPNMLNILPLYIILLAWFPVAYVLIKKSPAGALAISFAIWAAANIAGLNLPSVQTGNWFFNPFAWQLLLTIGAVAAFYVRSSARVQHRYFVWLAAAFVAFAFVVAAPWTRIPGLEATNILPRGIMGHMSKTNMSIWRLAHVVALGYLALSLIPKQADWLKSSAADFVSRCGRHSLEVFSLGTLLSFLGWIVLDKAGSGFGVQLLINGVGIGLLGFTAWYLAQRKQQRTAEAVAQVGLELQPRTLRSSYVRVR